MNASQTTLPHLTRWDEVERLVKQILEYRIPGEHGDEPLVLFPWSAGGGFELGAVIGSVPGSSSTLLGSAVLNDQDWSHAKLSFGSAQSCTPEVGDGLAAANYLEIQGTKGPDCNIRRIIGIGITATIATTDPNAGKRGGQRACISIRRHDGMRRITLRFLHSSEYPGAQAQKRKFQSQLIDLAALNLVAESLGLEQVPFLPEYQVSAEQGELLSAPSGLLLLPEPVGVWDVEKDFEQLIINTDGSVEDPSWLKPLTHTLIPCSANPFTPAHDEMALHLRRTGKSPVFLINTVNAEKGAVAVEDVLRRARSFIGRWPVVITKETGAFVDMAERFGCDFAIGADTAARIFLPKYCDDRGGLMNVYAQFKASGVHFTVFPRVDENGRTRTIDAVPSPFRDLFTEAPDVIPRFSSTEVRRASAR